MVRGRGRRLGAGLLALEVVRSLVGLMVVVVELAMMRMMTLTPSMTQQRWRLGADLWAAGYCRVRISIAIDYVLSARCAEARVQRRERESGASGRCMRTGRQTMTTIRPGSSRRLVGLQTFLAPNEALSMKEDEFLGRFTEPRTLPLVVWLVR